MEQKSFQKPQHTVTTAMLFRVVFSFSILSLLMFYSSSLVHLHVLRSCKLKLYSLPSDTNKNFMFLLCNGILCFIFNTSGLIRPSPTESQPPSADVDKNKQPKGSNVVAEEISEADCSENRAETDQEQRNHEGEEEHGRTCDMMVPPPVTAVDEEEEPEDDDEEAEDDDEEMLSLEELNKKCDDFIKKMKLEIRFEDA